MWRWFHVAPFFPNDIRGLYGAWRLDDGRVMRGPDIYYGSVAQEVAKANPGAFSYPTGTGIDLLIEQFSQRGSVYEKLVGKEGKDWRTLAAAPRLYERGSSLYWHRDTPSVVTGSCTYYCHNEWNIQWGGELFIAHPSAHEIPKQHGPSMIAPKEVIGRGLTQLSGHLDNREVNDALMKAGMGHYIMPKPNRLVVMKTNNPHQISKIHPSAGDHVRASVTLFLIRPGQEKSGGMR
ncbi:MAG: 2OG-Fe(II) oxygenase [Candidatus Competibacteraceae bacterium]